MTEDHRRYCSSLTFSIHVGRLGLRHTLGSTAPAVVHYRALVQRVCIDERRHERHYPSWVREWSVGGTVPREAYDLGGRAWRAAFSQDEECRPLGEAVLLLCHRNGSRHSPMELAVVGERPRVRKNVHVDVAFVHGAVEGAAVVSRCSVRLG